MNRYPLWKYIVIVVVLALATLYTVPNFFGEAPAVQVSSGKATNKVDATTLVRVEDALKKAGLTPEQISLEGNSVRARFSDTDIQIKAKDAISLAINPDKSDPVYVIALNLVPRSPQWMGKLNAFPMYLGLDLRGGVHFMLQVDMKGALDKKTKSFESDLRIALRDKNIRHNGITVNGQAIEIKLRDQALLQSTKLLVADQFADLQTTDAIDGVEYKLTASIKPDAVRRLQEQALKQNITTLSNRINQLGVSEPVIQQQGVDRIVVQLPGVQDTARAKDLLGRTATLEMRMVDESSEARAALSGGLVPFTSERYLERGGEQIIVKKQVILTGDNLSDAQAGFDSQSQEPAVHLTVDAKGARIMKDTTRENVGKRMAILLFEKGKGEVVTAPVIRSELGARFQISGRMSTQEANDTALLLRSGSLAAPMEIIEERTVGPSLGAENIDKGFKSVTWGFIVIVLFMCAYYMLFGVFSSLALAMNLMLLIAVLSLLQATLTLPGIAAIALTLGMAIDSNVLINERVREELRSGKSPQQAIHVGYESAWSTILDSNITTLIAGVALLIFGSGPVRGFAVVHCIGILTSMFSSVVVSRGLANLWYGRQKKLQSISIGQIWKPPGDLIPAPAASLAKKPAGSKSVGKS